MNEKIKLVILMHAFVLISSPVVCQNLKELKIGTSTLSITLPYKISSSTVNLPQSVKDKLTKYAFYEFVDKNRKISGKISCMIFKPEFDTSLETAAKGALNNMRSLQGIEKIIEDPLEYFTKDEMNGCVYRATIHRYGKVFYFAGAIVKSHSTIWNIPINYLEKEDVKIVDNILNSLK